MNNPNSTTTTTILRSKSPPNIYTRLPLKEYPSVSLTPTPMTPKLMTSSIVGYGSQSLSPTKHLLVTTTPFMENGGLTTTTTNLADKCILSSVRMPLLNVNYKAEINNRINNGIITNGSAMSQLSSTKESWKCLTKTFATFLFWAFPFGLANSKQTVAKRRQALRSIHIVIQYDEGKDRKKEKKTWQGPENLLSLLLKKLRIEIRKRG